MNDVDRLVLEKLLVVLIDLSVRSSEVLLRLLRSLDDDIAERDHLDVRYLLECGHMLAVGDTAAADYTDSYLIVCTNCSHFQLPPKLKHFDGGILPPIYRDGLSRLSGAFRTNI